MEYEKVLTCNHNCAYQHRCSGRHQFGCRTQFPRPATGSVSVLGHQQKASLKQVVYTHGESICPRRGGVSYREGRFLATLSDCTRQSIKISNEYSQFMRVAICARLVLTLIGVKNSAGWTTPESTWAIVNAKLITKATLCISEFLK